jgi:hypothetical protein
VKRSNAATKVYFLFLHLPGYASPDDNDADAGGWRFGCCFPFLSLLAWLDKTLPVGYGSQSRWIPWGCENDLVMSLDPGYKASGFPMAFAMAVSNDGITRA